MAKSYNGQFKKMTETEEVKASIRDAAKHKKKRKTVRKMLRNIDTEAKRIGKDVETGEFHPRKHKKQTLKEGIHKKSRDIEKPWFRDEQIVHHMLVRQLKPVLIPRMYAHSYGSLPKKGSLKAQQVFTRWCRGYNGKKFYVAELDIHKFYASINTEKLKKMLAKLFRDKRYLKLWFEIIDAAAPGLPLGYYTSPWLGHLYLLAFDEYVLQVVKPDHYERYMDNLYLTCRSKRKLHRMVEMIREYLGTELDLTLNEEWQVYRFEYPRKDGAVDKKGRIKTRGRAVNCLGYVIHYNRVTLRKGILERTRAKANRMSRTRRLRYIDAASIVSRCGWFKHTDTYGYFHDYIKPKVNIRRCRKRIAAHNRKERVKYDRLENCTRRPSTGAA